MMRTLALSVADMETESVLDLPPLLIRECQEVVGAK